MTKEVSLANITVTRLESNRGVTVVFPPPGLTSSNFLGAVDYLNQRVKVEKEGVRALQLRNDHDLLHFNIYFGDSDTGYGVVIYRQEYIKGRSLVVVPATSSYYGYRVDMT